MSELIEKIDKYLGAIPDEFIEAPNDMIQIIIEARQQLAERDVEIEQLKEDIEINNTIRKRFAECWQEEIDELQTTKLAVNELVKAFAPTESRPLMGVNGLVMIPVDKYNNWVTLLNELATKHEGDDESA